MYQKQFDEKPCARNVTYMGAIWCADRSLSQLCKVFFDPAPILLGIGMCMSFVLFFNLKLKHKTLDFDRYNNNKRIPVDYPFCFVSA